MPCSRATRGSSAVNLPDAQSALGQVHFDA
jgi:hypothetical protein